MSAIAAVRARAVAIPAKVWLAGIVGVSIAVRIAMGREIVAPWIMSDELVYSDLAKSFAATGQFAVRGVPSHGYGFVYPVLISPAWRLFASIPDAYAAAKVINAVAMSLTAIPAYFLARRVLPQRLSLVAAVLAVLVPEMLYTGEIMTENAFYPLFVLAAYLLVSTLEQPTARRQLALLVVTGIAFECRAQAIALFPAIAFAPLVLALIERRGLRPAVRRFAILYGILVVGAFLAVVGTLARGRSLTTLLGAYRAATSTSYTVSGVSHYLLYHVAELDLFLGILPFAALLSLWLAPRRSSPAGRAFAAASLCVSVFVVAEVAAFASASYVDRIEERNMFYLAPFGLTALLALARDGIVTPRRRPLLIAAAVAGVLPVLIPYKHFINTSAVSDTFALLPWWWVQDHLIHMPQVRWAALGVSLAAAALYLLLPRRLALVLPALVALYFVGTTYLVQYARHGIGDTTRGDLYVGTHYDTHPDWIDRLVGRNASVAILWTGTLPYPYPAWEDEFFNRSVRTVYDVNGATPPDPLPEIAVSRSPDGDLVAADGRPVKAEYVLTPGGYQIGGKLIEADGAGVDLYRVDGPIVAESHVRGIFPGSTWSGKHVLYRRVECDSGKLAVTLQGDSHLFPTPQTVVARENGATVGRTRIPVNGETTMIVPLRPTANGVCTVRFTVGRTAVPAQVEPNLYPDDTRHLGAHFLDITPVVS